MSVLGGLPAIGHRPLIVLLLAAIGGLLILLLTALLVIGRLRLGAVCRLLTQRAQKNISKKLYWRGWAGLDATLVGPAR